MSENKTDMEHVDPVDPDAVGPDPIAPDPIAPDPIAAALHQAGPRPPLPTLDLESLSAPARAAWQVRVIEKRQRRRRTMVLAAALGALILGLAYFALVLQNAPIGRVIASSETGADPVYAGPELTPGLVSTSEAEWLTLELHTEHRLRLDASTQLRLDSGSRVELLAGRIYVQAAEPRLEVIADGAEIRHVGTAYEVSLLDGPLSVRVRHGRVRVKKGDVSEHAGAGERIREENGDLVVEATSTHGESWSWTRKAPPFFDTDAATFEEIFGWIEEETGFEVEVDRELLFETGGQPEHMGGAMTNPTPELILEQLLFGFDLDYRVEGNRLVIFDPAAPSPEPEP